MWQNLAQPTRSACIGPRTVKLRAPTLCLINTPGLCSLKVTALLVSKANAVFRPMHSAVAIDGNRRVCMWLWWWWWASSSQWLSKYSVCQRLFSA